jgi:hypothetical protein
MKTIFITAFSGVEGKNVLRSGIGETLLAQDDVRIVCLVKNKYFAEHYRAEFAGKPITFELVEKYHARGFDAFLGALKFHLLRTATVDLHRRTKYEEDHNALRYALSFIANRVLARPLVRGVVRALDQRFVARSPYAKLFETHKPDLIFMADLFDDAEIALLREARRASVPSIGLINTWDRTTSRWMIRLLPDRYVVFNEVMKKEMIQYADMPEDRIYISGTVQHDHLITGKRSTRAEFLKELGIPTANKVIVYCPIGGGFDRSRPELDPGIVEHIERYIGSGVLGTKDVTLVVRFHPNDVVDLSKWKQYPNVVYDRPGKKFTEVLSDAVFARTRGQNWDMGEDDLQHLRDTLFHADIVVCYYTSLSIDAAVTDRPVVNINFDIKNGEIIERPHPYYRTTHYRKVADTGGITLVQCEKDLVSTLKAFLADPKLDADKRARLVREQCYKTDGNSGKRVATFILERLKT